MDRRAVARVLVPIALLLLGLPLSASVEGGDPESTGRPPAKAPVSFPFAVGEIPPGETLVLEFQASVPAAPVPAGVESVSNQATVSATGLSDLSTDDPDTMVADDPTVTPIAAAPDLAVVKAVADILDDLGATTGQTAVVRPGNTLVYQLAYQNKAAATQAAASAQLFETIPANTTFDAANSAAGWNCLPGTAAGSVCILGLGTLAPGDSANAAFAVTVDQPLTSAATEIANTAGITQPPDDPIPADNTSTVMTGLRNEADIGVGIGTDLPMPIVSETLVATITVTNSGPEPATNVVIDDDLSASAFLIFGGDDAGSTGTTYAFGTGTWTIPGPLASGASVALNVTLTVGAGTAPGTSSAINAGLVGLNETDPNAANDTDSGQIEVKAGDYGDAPDPSYPTVLRFDGARHAIPTAGATLFLGAAIDGDADGQPNADATGDDADAGGDDEDGVAIAVLIRGEPVVFDVTASAAGLFSAWIDFNGDGTWSRAEQVFSDQPVVAGAQTLTSALLVPAAAVADTFVRSRLSSAAELLPFGRALDGEVEDDTVSIFDLPGLSVADARVAEGDPGDDRRLVFSITRSANENAVTVDVATRDGSAAAGVDYQAIATTPVTFAAGGGLSQNVEVLVLEDGGVEADENLFLDLSNAVGAAIVDGEGEGTIENDDFDEVSPTVESVEVVGHGELDPCRTVLGDVSQLTVRFSEPMANADDPAQYRLIAAGPDGDVGPTACGALPSLDDREVAILAAASDGDPMTPTVSLDLAGAPRTSDAYRLLVCGSLTDDAGNRLDGGAGSGTDLVRLFRIDRFNRFANGHFDDCDPADIEPVATDGWTLTPGLVTTNRDDADGAGISASIVADLATTDTVSAAQAAVVVGGVRLALRSRFRLVFDGGLAVRFGHACSFFDQPGGIGVTLSAFEDNLELAATTAGWEARTTLFSVPAGAISARCAMSVTGLADGVTPPMYQLFLDDLSLDSEVFSDGFESGDTSPWSDVVPASALAPEPVPPPADPDPPDRGAPNLSLIEAGALGVPKLTIELEQVP